jgi:hypothetical protein
MLTTATEAAVAAMLLLRAGKNVSLISCGKNVAQQQHFDSLSLTLILLSCTVRG